MAFLNEILGESNKLVALLKFSKKEHLESLREGNLYLNNFKYFRNLEKEEGKKGQGDSKDLTLVLNEVNYELKNMETSEVIFRGKAKQSFLESEEDYKRHVFCCTGITPDILEVIEVKDDVASARLILPEELRVKALDDFGGHVAFINSGIFFEKIRKACNDQGISMFSNIVSYKDMNINHSERIHAFNDNESSFFFEKDLFFKYQNEYRLVFPDLISDEPEVLKVGSLEDAITILSVEEFLNMELQFNFNLYKVEV